MPFIRRSTLNTLRARVESYAQAVRDARRDEQTALGNCRRFAEQVAVPDETLTQLREARRQLEARDRRIRQLQEQLDDALGMNDQRVKDGACWQSNRTDKPWDPRTA